MPNKMRRSSRACPLEVCVKEPGMGEALTQYHCHTISGAIVNEYMALELRGEDDMLVKTVNARYVHWVRMNPHYCTPRQVV